MAGVDRISIAELVNQARRGDGRVMGELLELYRNYLTMLAQLQLDRRLHGKADASDLVQETFLEAHHAFPSFRGNCEAELLQWLRRILASRLSALIRRFLKSQQRDVRLEERLEEDLDKSSRMACVLAGSGSSPSEKADRREQAVLLADALAKLPDHYRQVIVLRHLEELTFPEVAERMGKSVGSVKNLWVRALTTLKEFIGDSANAVHGSP
jgi:RNA polymerase sigma-70 factor (ECF subfamily)